jgi:hypothetical protein
VIWEVLTWLIRGFCIGAVLLAVLVVASVLIEGIIGLVRGRW